MESFSKLLNASNEQIKQARVLNVIRNTANCSKQKIENKLSILRDLENQIESLMDVRPNTTVDLNSSLKSFDPDTFINNLYDSAISIYDIYQEILVGINIHNALFPEDPIEGLNSYDSEFIKNIVGNV